MNLTTIGDQILILLGDVRDSMSPRAVETFQSYADELRMLAKLPEEKETGSTPKFGQARIISIHASVDNPHKIGIFVEVIRRRGRMNPGKHYRVTDGKGDFWEVPEENALIGPNE